MAAGLHQAGGGIGYVEDPGDYGFETRTIHTFVLLSLPSPVPNAPVLASDEQGSWPSYPDETIYFTNSGYELD